MQLQQSLFSLHNIIVRKMPLIIWIILMIIISVMIVRQSALIKEQQPIANYEDCLFQYFLNSRPQQPIQSAEKKAQQSDNKPDVKPDTNPVPWNLRPQYYNLLNSTTMIRIFITEEQIDKKSATIGNGLNCRIFLNTQQKNFYKQNQSPPKPQQKQNQNEGKDPLLQQIAKQQGVILSQEVTLQDQKTLKGHAFMHITANNHILYIDQTEQLIRDHSIHSHSIILKKQPFSLYQDGLWGIFDRYWTFYGDYRLISTERLTKSLAESLKSVRVRIRDLYRQEQEILVNQLEPPEGNLQVDEKQGQKQQIVDPNKLNEQNQNAQNQNNKGEAQNSNPITVEKDDKTQQQQNQKKQQNSKQITFTIPGPEVYPLSNIYLYFHYPSALHYQDINSLLQGLQKQMGFFYKIIFFIFCVGVLIILSMFIGLIVRYMFILIATAYLFMGGCFINSDWGWVYKYFNLVRNRQHNNNALSMLSSCKILVFFAIASVGTLSIFTYGCKYAMESLYIFVLPMSQTYYSEMLLKNFFFIQLFFYVCCRSRLSIRAFPVLSMCLSLFILFLSRRQHMYDSTWYMNMHLWGHLFLMALFCIIQNLIGRSTEFHDDFTPSIHKPRAMYYAGYDISWQNSLAPIWTYFTRYYDLKYFGEKQKSLIDRDYQLLYGRMLGMNERQQLPEDQQPQIQEEEVHKLNQNLSQSNEMNLIN